MITKAKFEVVSKYADIDIDLIPKRSTTESAGYDFVAAQDTVVPSYLEHLEKLKLEKTELNNTLSLDQMAALTKMLGAKPTLIPTGVKVYLKKNQFLKIVSRSSSPLKYWLICANSEGIIDGDYVDNPDNEGEIFFQVINLSPFSLKINKGEKICQGIIQEYITTLDDTAEGARMGGFGSTDL